MCSVGTWENGPLLYRASSFQISTSLNMGPEHVSLLEKCPHFRGCMHRLCGYVYV